MPRRTTPTPDRSRASGGERPLTPKQQLFVEAYLGRARGNGTEAARLAGYKGNDVTLQAVASENLRKPLIAEAVDKRLDAALDCMSADEVLREISDVGRASWREFISVQMDDEGNELSVKMSLKDKLKALELMAKHHKLLTDNLVIGGKLSLLEAIREAGSNVGQ